MFHLDWSGMFLPGVPVGEIVLRGSIVYLALFIMLRVVLKRQSGTVGIADLLVVVLIADAAQNAMASDYKSLTDGIILVATIVFWSYALDWLGYHVPAFNALVRPPPLLLVNDGKMLRRNMRHELITEDELLSQIRQQGIDSLDEVAKAYMEGDGRISVVQHAEKQHAPAKREAG